MIDKEKFRQAFLEEARDVVVELESALLELNDHPGDQELVGRAFRALHTIKGSGAMFGFDELSGFVHNLENAFDEVRNARLAVTPELINLSLEALDQIKAMLAEANGEGTASRESAARILAKVHRLTERITADPSPAAAASASSAASPLAPPAPPADDLIAGAPDLAKACPVASPTEPLQAWQIHFSPGLDMMRSGANPLLLLRELRQMGRLEVTASMAGMPPLAQLDPERCYMSWDAVIRTSAAREAIADVFIFVTDTCELSITPLCVAEAAEAAEAAGESSPEAAATEAGLKAKSRTAPQSSGREKTPLEAAERTAAKPPPWGRRASDTPDNASSIRVPAAKLDQFVNLVGELVTVQARLMELAMRREDAEMVSVSEEIERLTSALRESSISIRMLPIRATFERFRRLVHDLARDLHKQVELSIEGAETELDKSVLDQLNDPLMHLIRNSMDHGIETADQRLAKAKRPSASIHLSARHSGASVLITVADDGAGIDAAAVRERAIEKGMVSAEAQLTEKEIFAFILAPGFSTAREITDVSGRGVGMDVVRRNVESLRGTIDISSETGKGSSVTMRLPLTLAIIDGLLVRVAQSYFILPLATTLECIELTQQDIEKANGKHVANVRGEIIPYIRLREYFGIRTARPEREQIMVAETEDGQYGFVVDEVLGDHQTVIKNLGQFYRHVDLVSGATILGNGTVALILDPQRLVRDAIRNVPASSGAARGIYARRSANAVAGGG